MKRREEWFDGLLDRDPEQLIINDETCASTSMALLWQRATRQEIACWGASGAPGKPPLSSLAWSRTGMIAPWGLDGPMNVDAVTVYVSRLLMPRLSPGNVDLRAKYRTMVTAGKPPKVAMTTIMRKLVALANTLLKADRRWTNKPA